MTAFREKSKELFVQGYSCSESVVRAAHECGIISSNFDINMLNALSSSFSGGMGSSGCVCGAVAGAQIVLGLVTGRSDISSDPNNIRGLAKQLVDNFKEKRKVTCCKVLTADYKDNPAEKRVHCSSIVEDAAEVLEGILRETLVRN